jgi:hypothetical protein
MHSWKEILGNAFVYRNVRMNACVVFTSKQPWKRKKNAGDEARLWRPIYQVSGRGVGGTKLEGKVTLFGLKTLNTAQYTLEYVYWVIFVSLLTHRDFKLPGLSFTHNRQWHCRSKYMQCDLLVQNSAPEANLLYGHSSNIWSSVYC